MKNTFTKGQVKVLVYKEKEGNVWYATALEFNLTVDGDDKSTVLIELQQAIIDYMQSAREVGDDALLNQDPDPELLAIWEASVYSKASAPSPYTPAFAGVEQIA